MDPGYLPNPINFEYNLVLQNLEFKEETEFISYEESENSNCDNSNCILDNSNNTNNNIIQTNSVTKNKQNKIISSDEFSE